jgi:hypothetical protein
MSYAVKYIPYLTCITLFFFPRIMPIMTNPQFPIFKAMGYSIRITEVYYLILLMICISWLIKTGFSYYLLANNYKNNILIMYLFTMISILFIGLLHGIYVGNPNIMLDLRGLFYSLFTLLFITTIRSAYELNKFFDILVVLLMILTSSILLNSMLKLGDFAKYSNLTVFMSLYLFCITYSRYIFLKKHKLTNFMFSFVGILGAILSLQKQALLGAFVAIFLCVVIRKGPEMKKTALKSFSIIFALMIMFVVFFVNLKDASDLFNYDFVEYYSNRILRLDSGDISGGRFTIWNRIINYSLANPLWGSGIGVEGLKTKNISILIHEHSIVFWVMHRFSFTGLTIFLLLVYSYYRYTKNIFYHSSHPVKKSLLFGNLVFFITYLSVNTVMLSFFVFESAIIFWLCVSVPVIVKFEDLKFKNITHYIKM